MDLPERAPAAGLRLMLAVALLFALVAIYGRWQHARRAEVIRATIVTLPNVSPAAPSPNEH